MKTTNIRVAKLPALGSDERRGNHPATADTSVRLFSARESALHTVAAGRAGEGMRSAWREQLARIQREIGFQTIRFHGLFHDEMHIYGEKNGVPFYRWWYIDDLFDFLLSIGLRPFVEFGFTPSAMASGPQTVFQWKANITPPGSYDRWRDLITATVRHWIDRYGPEEVRRWHFEVWNEPNLGGIFWTGTQEEYFELYRATAEAVKECDSLLRVGGPATSNFTTDGEAPWWQEFVRWCDAHAVPVDFLSCHPYPNGWAFDGDGVQQTQYRDRGALEQDLAWMNRFRRSENTAIHLTEWNSSPSPRDPVHDTAFMGPFLLDSLVKLNEPPASTAYWVFTDLFEENGLGDTLFHGGFGLMTVNGIPKPSYHAYRFLARAGSWLVELGEDHAVTFEPAPPGPARPGSDFGPDRAIAPTSESKLGGNAAGPPERAHASVRILLWNYTHYTQEFAGGDRSRVEKEGVYGAFEDGEERRFIVELPAAVGTEATIQWVDRDTGSARDAAERLLGSWEIFNLTHGEEQTLRESAQPGRRTLHARTDGTINRYEFNLAPHGIALLTVPVLG